MSPEILKMTRHNGIAGQYSYSVALDYGPENGGVSNVAFTALDPGAPGVVVMITDTGTQTYVSNPGRYGDTLNKSWIRAFFAPRPEGSQ